MKLNSPFDGPQTLSRMNGHKHILLIEDEPSIVEVLAEILTVFGFDVSCVSTGRNGLKEIEIHKPDVLLLDMTLPDIDGYHVLREIRERERKNGISDRLPVLVMTGRGLPTQVLCETEGIDGFLQKPFDHGELLGALARIFCHDTEIEEKYGT